MKEGVMTRGLATTARFLVCGLAAVLCAACGSTTAAQPDQSAWVKTSAANMVYANGMRIGSLPNLDVLVSSPLVLAQGDSRLASIPSDTNLKASASLDYALFVQEQHGVVQAEAHIMVVAISDEYSWRLAKETFPRRNELELGNGELGGLTWKEHFLYVQADGDWFSRFLTTNSVRVPQMWLARRWSKTYFDKIRVVLEYREPMPSCVQLGDTSGEPQMVRDRFRVSSPQCNRELEAFNERARGAFTVTPNIGKKRKGLAPAAPLFTATPQGSPDIGTLVGRANSGGIWEKLQ